VPHHHDVLPGGSREDVAIDAIGTAAIATGDAAVR
jgi:hypothetical protein